MLHDSLSLFNTLNYCNYSLRDWPSIFTPLLFEKILYKHVFWKFLNYPFAIENDDSVPCCRRAHQEPPLYLSLVWERVEAIGEGGEGEPEGCDEGMKWRGGGCAPGSGCYSVGWVRYQADISHAWSCKRQSILSEIQFWGCLNVNFFVMDSEIVPSGLGLSNFAYKCVAVSYTSIRMSR